MIKKVIGIILIILGGIFTLFAIGFGLLFGGIGTVFNVAGTNVDDDFMQESTTKSCSGEVIDVEDSSTTVAYEVDGEFYTVEINMKTSTYSVGTDVTVYYNENNPEECCVPELTEATLGIIGGVFSAFGIGFAIIFGVIGIACLIVGIILIKKSNPVKDEPMMNTTNSVN